MLDDTFLKSFVKTADVPIQDLSWLDIDEEEYRKHERLPDNKKTLNSKDQLRSLWDHKLFKGPAQFNFIPNVEQKPVLSSTQEVTQEAIANLIQRVRLAMAQGIFGAKLSSFIRENFDQRTIQASTRDLSDLSKEHGLLGFIYIDPSLYNCQDSKISTSEYPFVRFVLKRNKCSSCTFNSKETCLKFEKPLVLKVSFDESLVKEVKQSVASHGFIFDEDSSLSPSEQIRRIFLTKREQKSENLSTHLQEHALEAEVDISKADEILNLASIKAQEKIKLNEIEKNASAINSIVKFLKTCFIKQVYGKKAVNLLQQKFTVDNLRLAETEIRSLFKEQGLFGGVYITLGSFENCDEIASILKKSNATARFMQKENVCESCVHASEDKCLKLDLTFLDKDIPVNAEIFNYFVEQIASQKKISKQNILDKIGNLKNKRDRLKQLFLLSFNQSKESEKQEASLYTLSASNNKSDIEQNKRLIEGIKISLKKGVKIESIHHKLESLCPGTKIAFLFKAAFLESDLINTNAFRYCQKLGSQGYKINKDARLEPKSACKDCLFNSKVYCTKLGRKFVAQEFKKSLESNVTQDSEEIKNFFQGSKISVKLSERPKTFKGEIEGLNEFTIE